MTSRSGWSYAPMSGSVIMSLLFVPKQGRGLDRSVCPSSPSFSLFLHEGPGVYVAAVSALPKLGLIKPAAKMLICSRDMDQKLAGFI
jgi:hypothetical protein